MGIIDYVKNIFRREKIYLERFNLAYERGDLKNATKILKNNKGLIRKLEDEKISDIENFMMSSLKEDSMKKETVIKKLSLKTLI